MKQTIYSAAEQLWFGRVGMEEDAIQLRHVPWRNKKNSSEEEEEWKV